VARGWPNVDRKFGGELVGHFSIFVHLLAFVFPLQKLPLWPNVSCAFCANFAFGLVFILLEPKMLFSFSHLSS